MINITSTQGVITIVLTEKDAHDLSIAVKEVTDNEDQNHLTEYGIFFDLEQQILKHV